MALWIAKRYMMARRSMQFISVVTFLSLAGITVGVAAIICVSSIFNGFRQSFQQSMIAFDPHLKVSAEKGKYLNRNSKIVQSIRETQHVSSLSEVVEGRAVLRAGNAFHVINLSGVQAKEFRHSSALADSIKLGSFLSDQAKGLPQLVVGAGLANAADLRIGDTLSILSPEFISNALQSLAAPTGVRCVVSGIFFTSSNEYNNSNCYTDISSARQIYSADDQALTSIELRLDDVENTDLVQSSLKSVLPADIRIDSWYDLHRDLYGVMRFERIASFIILSVIVLVSVFNIFAMLSMTIVKKRVDIALLMSLGADAPFIQRIFTTEGLLIGCIGTICGFALGLGLCELQLHFRIFQLDQSTFVVPSIPIAIAWWDIAAICFLTIVLSYAATIFPARKAARVLIAKALRTE